MPYPVGPVRFGRPPFLPPQELRVLPFNAVRSSLATRNPVQAGAALIAAQVNATQPGYAPPVLMPRHMIQSQWKRGQGGQNRGPFRPAMASGQSWGATIAAEDARRARFAPVLQPVATLPAHRFVDSVGANRLARVPGRLSIQGQARTRPTVIAAPPPTPPFDVRRFVQARERAALVTAHVQRMKVANGALLGAAVRRR